MSLKIPIKPSEDCPHDEINLDATTNRVNEAGKFKMLTLCATVTCTKCGGSFAFNGLPQSILLTEPSVNSSGCVASLPLVPWDGQLRIAGA